MSVCRFHSERAGIGICIRCRVVICSECCTKVDGINHCHACLKVLGTAADALYVGSFSQRLSLAVQLGLAWLFFLGIGWLAQGVLAP